MKTVTNGTVLKSTALLLAAIGWPAVSQAAIVINEIDYDQPGTDTAEFIEIYNSDSTSVSLDDFSIDLVNGNNGSSYRSIELSGFRINASGYFVVCGDASLVANCDYSFTTRSGWFQNGSPDAVALLENGIIVDAIAYEGMFSPYTEGDPLELADSNTDVFSLSRLPNGFDSNNNLLDFQQGCLTPGSANIAGSGDCSLTSVSTVPIPAAAWLFGSGILGLIGAVRRKQA